MELTSKFWADISPSALKYLSPGVKNSFFDSRVSSISIISVVSQILFTAILSSQKSII
jgi:hypothetical protein